MQSSTIIQQNRRQAKEEGLELLARGVTPRVVADALGVSRRTAERWRAEVGGESVSARASAAELVSLQRRKPEPTVRDRAVALLKLGHPPKEVAQRIGASRRTVEWWREQHRLRPSEVARKSAADLQRFRQRHERTHQELRDIRKGDKWQQLAIDFTHCAYDLLPESVWSCLLAGESVDATFSHPNIPRADQQYTLWLDEEQRSVMREPIAVRESCDLDDDVSDDPAAQRNRYGRALREEMYGA